MNISTLARKLKITTKELKEKLPELGFDIGMKAIQIPDEQAKRVIEVWQTMKKEEEKKKYLKKLEEKLVRKEVKEEKKITLPQVITVHSLAEKLNLPLNKVIQQLIKNGVLVTINDNLDFEIAAIISEQLGFKIKKEDQEIIEEKKEIQTKEKLEKLLREKDKELLQTRPPVVVVMGHIDHGKTSLLDKIRETNVAAQEAGAITQHIGAYQISQRRLKVAQGETKTNLPQRQNQSPSAPMITFIDTPGHEAFKVLRARGGQVADLAILVIAADDGVQPQTIESLKIIQKEKLPFIVAINKIDKPEADPERIKKQLAELNVIPEDWGGQTICHLISAKTGQGIDELLDLILLVAEMEKEKLSVNPNRPAVGTIIEAHIDKGEGPVATVIIQTGTLKRGDSFVIGKSYGKIRALRDWQGKEVIEAPPSMPVKIIGLKNLPRVGDILEVKDEKYLKQIKKKSKEKKFFLKMPVAVIKAKGEEKEGKKEKKFLVLIVRADVVGSLEVIIDEIKKLETPEVGIKIIKRGLGDVNEIDVLEAKKSQALIVGFHVEILAEAKKIAEDEKVKIGLYKVIYDLVEAVKKELAKVTGPRIKEVFLGKVKILALFRREDKFSIVGGKVLEGKIMPQAKIRLWRDDNLIGEGKLAELQINKREVKEAGENEECGIKYQGTEEIKIGDILEVCWEEKM